MADRFNIETLTNDIGYWSVFSNHSEKNVSVADYRPHGPQFANPDAPMLVYKDISRERAIEIVRLANDFYAAGNVGDDGGDGHENDIIGAISVIMGVRDYDASELAASRRLAAIESSGWFRYAQRQNQQMSAILESGRIQADEDGSY